MAKGNHRLAPNGNTWAILDANVMIPPRLSDILFDMFLEGFYLPRWTKEVEIEFLRNFPIVIFGKTKAERKKIAASAPDPVHVAAATNRLQAFRNAAGPEYEVLLHDQKEFTDQVPKDVHADDIHVVSAALVVLDRYASANPNDRVYIVSDNLAHLAAANVQALGVTVVPPGQFIDLVFAAAGPAAMQLALDRTINDLITPPFTRAKLLRCLTTHGAINTTKYYSGKWKVG